jgi:hypothetical protein
MRKLTLILALAVALALGGASSAGGERYVQTCLRSSSPPPSNCSLPRIEFNLGASVVPTKLLKRRLTPVGLVLKVKIATTDGTQPSALRELTVDFDRDWAIDGEGLPTCGRRSLDAARTAAARRACRSAIVGRGMAYVQVQSAGSEPVAVPLTLFNGGTRSGKTTMLVYGSTPAQATPVAIVAPIEVEEEPHGGLHAVAKIPPIANGTGSLLGFNLEIRRTFMRDGRERSYLAARCPDGVFKVQASAGFRNELHTPGVAATTTVKGAIAVPCTAEG